MRIKITLLLTFALFVNFLNAQKGTLTGTIKDGEINDVLPFATVLIKDSDKGTTSDFEGIYTLELEAGTYTVVFKFLGFETVEVTGVILNADDVTTLDITLKEASGTLDEVVITAETAQNTEASVLNIQRRSVNLLDGISSQNFKKLGASDLANAVKSVPGVSIQGGKYVYVRGLGDRYTKTILNGVDIPGLDPDRNTIQMDIFPTNIIDNIIVVKSATADMPADFTGGIVDIVTKEFPVKKEFSLSVSGTYNSNMHFKNNYLSYKGGATDFLGYDDGKRALPISPYQPIPNTFDNNPFLTEITKRFDPTLGAKESNSTMDYSIGFTAGNQYKIGKKDNRLGYIASLSYKNETNFYEDAENNFYRKDPNTSNIEMPLSKSQKGNLGEKNVVLSGLVGLSFKTELSKYKINVMRIQNGESSAGEFDQLLNEGDFAPAKKHSLAYTERSITNGLLSGTHTNNDASWKTEWNLASTLSTIYDKDIRATTFRLEEDGSFSIPQNSEPRRIWRGLEEENHVGKLDITRKYNLFKKDAKLKVGAYGSYKQRTYNIYTFRIGIAGPSGFNGNANAILADENLWTTSNQEGSFIRNTSVVDPVNIFESNQINIAGYISNEFNLGEKLKTILGIRVENFMLNYTGQNSQKEVLNNESIINKLDLFPSVNFIYALTDNKNVRLSYARTTARPSFKEASNAEIFDALSDITYIGNIDLKPTYINNIDLRYEVFGDNSQLFAVSGFYKSFTDPIELTYYQSALDNFTPQNLGKANVLGAEIELRKNLGFLSSSLENFRFNLNASIIQSKLEMGNDEFTLRQNTARPGESVNDTRELQGQSPYLINAGLDYNNDNIGLQTGLFYNVQGKTLEVVGGANPDVFTMPYNSLNFTLNKTLGKEKNANLTFKITNLLGAEKESIYQSYKAQDQIFSKRNPGTSFSLGYSIKF
ncbi:TonB-dependent receptor [Aureibaculum sp. 2210JD6-5]|uniref:TonB-dependent receptor n=1 Tax=Aureibaculum sp. 2210JD6-5 TaxID=3103957 RepID=UPI002AAD851C|nr:TonB-dependent receptor [Aureibaculum sp. 2210JD6-5]MDY7396506.1 TonB-dependent receptor [Aureibaculum sp. 2210JD6-5]